MNRTSLGLLAAVVLLAAGLRWLPHGKAAPARTDEAAGAAALPPPSNAPKAHASGAESASETHAVRSDFPEGTGFASPERRAEHYRKHGAEFGGISMAEYVVLAQRLRDVPAGGNILEVRRQNGDVARFDRGSGAFGVYEPNGIIRTFFKPNDGEAYFRRQARLHS